MNIVINGPQNNNGGSTVAAGDGDGSSGGSNSALRGSGGAGREIRFNDTGPPVAVDRGIKRVLHTDASSNK